MKNKNQTNKSPDATQSQRPSDIAIAEAELAREAAITKELDEFLGATEQHIFSTDGLNKSFCKMVLTDRLSQEDKIKKLDKMLHRKEYAAHIDSRTSNHSTPPILAGGRGDKKIVEFLLKNFADIDAQNNNKETAVMRAVKGRHQGTTSLLIDMGANINIADSEGVTVAEHAKANGISLTRDEKDKTKESDKSKKPNKKENWSPKRVHFDTNSSDTKKAELLLSELNSDVTNNTFGILTLIDSIKKITAIEPSLLENITSWMAENGQQHYLICQAFTQKLEVKNKGKNSR